jgi:hypothetical protein
VLGEGTRPGSNGSPKETIRAASDIGGGISASPQNAPSFLGSKHQPEIVDIKTLRFGDTPRLNREEPSHTMQLAEVDGALPPIVVHRDSHHVIDGVHRVYAALMNGHETVEALYYDGPPEEAFIIAVALNTQHGLPLTLPDRRAAAARIIQTHPQWSDRAVAGYAGLSGKTVAAIRRATADSAQLNMRLGRDGRVRPINAAKGRQAAAEYLRAHPESSLRAVARIAGVSPNTVRNVRDLIAQGQDPIPTICETKDGGSSKNPSNKGVSVRRAPLSKALPLLDTLARDPSLRMTAAGRTLLRWLHGHAVDDVDIVAIAETSPDHCLPLLAEFAERCAHNWTLVSEALRVD